MTKAGWAVMSWCKTGTKWRIQEGGSYGNAHFTLQCSLRAPLKAGSLCITLCMSWVNISRFGMCCLRKPKKSSKCFAPFFMKGMQNAVICLLLWSMFQHALAHTRFSNLLMGLAPESLISHPLELMCLIKANYHLLLLNIVRDVMVWCSMGCPAGLVLFGLWQRSGELT